MNAASECRWDQGARGTDVAETVPEVACYGGEGVQGEGGAEHVQRLDISRSILRIVCDFLETTYLVFGALGVEDLAAGNRHLLELGYDAG